jgi:hypothetical protein
MVCACIGALGASACASSPTSDTPPAPADSYYLHNGRVYVALSEVGTLLGVGGALKLTLEDANGSQQNLILLRPGETDYLASANARTHNGKELDYLHGSIAPPSAESLPKTDRLGLTEDSSEWYSSKAVKEPGAYIVREFGCLVTGELGPGSMAIPHVAGGRLGFPSSVETISGGPFAPCETLGLTR